jgi:hypothetical protein
MVTVRNARPTDVARYCKYVMPREFVGRIAEKAGEPIGGGLIVFFNDQGWVSFEGTEELKKHKMVILREGKRLVGAAQQVVDELYTLEDAEELAGSKWLEWLGFRPTGETVKGFRVLKWQR